jgi:tRNA G18 (ribose-2'-O)-methylase SpoU
MKKAGDKTAVGAGASARTGTGATETAETIVILDAIRSSYNVGSIFRTSDALGVNKIILAGYTPAPKDKFDRANGEISKVALGAEESVDWESVEDTRSVIRKLKKRGFHVVAIEQDKRATDYKKFKKVGPTVFVFGNEVDGLSPKTIAACDEVLEIPMRGEKESLNVSVAFGIALARILKL